MIIELSFIIKKGIIDSTSYYVGNSTIFTPFFLTIDKR